MDEQIFDLIIQLEDDLTMMYRKLSSISRFARMKSVLEFMVKQCSEHSMSIKKMGVNTVKPTFNVSAVSALHTHIKDNLFYEAIKEPNLNKSVDNLARGEENIGKLYLSIADYYKKLAEFYLKIGDGIEKIAGEEFNHRDEIASKKESIQ